VAVVSAQVVEALPAVMLVLKALQFEADKLSL
jgi:hypothetical protein